ncbi:hypothetical protein [Lacisediminihabitans sp. H27-G8]|uniref:hypothetical protein n=1 Tax=Lacisediminihabitans sp. H27-G8 TaxID=3111909 RepID=UPI0038FBF33C
MLLSSPNPLTVADCHQAATRPEAHPPWRYGGFSSFDFHTDQASWQQSTTSIISFVISVLAVIALWRIFAKAGSPGWLAIIRIIRIIIVIVLVHVSAHSGWSVLLLLIPITGLVWSIVDYLILGFDSSACRDRRSFAAQACCVASHAGGRGGVTMEHELRRHT